MPGALIKGTGHFAAATTPADSDTASAYGELDGVVGQITKRLQEMSPPDADPQAVADEIARLIDLPAPPDRPPDR